MIIRVALLWFFGDGGWSYDNVKIMEVQLLII